MGDTGAGDDAPSRRRADATDDTEESWRFDLDEVGEDGIVTSRVEAGEPDPENAAFVVLGVVAMLLVFAHLWVLVT